MVKIIDVLKRANKEGKSFMVLTLAGDIELIQSQRSGRFYCTSKTCTVTCTFSEEVAKSLVGTQMNGTVQRVECEPYNYILKETGETLLLSHCYEYRPEGEPMGENKQFKASAV